MRAGQTEKAELFVRYGAKRTDPQLTGVEELTAACLRMDTEKVRSLLAGDSELVRATKPMFVAADRDRDDIIRLLLDLGVSPDVANAENERTLHMAAYSGALRVAQLLIDRGAEIDPVETNWGNTPLGAAVWSQHQKMIDLIGRVSRDIWELTYVGNAQRLREILAETPDLAKVTSGGHTPLMWLVPDNESDALEIAKLLLAHGADPTLENKEGETAADRALRLGLFEVAELLRS